MADDVDSTVGVITDAWCAESLRRAAGLAKTCREHNPWPVVVYVTQDMKAAAGQYRGEFDDMVFVCNAQEKSLRFSNKLHFLLSSPFAKTLWLDNDILVFGSLDGFVTRLATAPFSMLVYQVPIAADHARKLPGYPIACRYGRSDVTERAGGGHFYFARSTAAINLVHEVLYFSTPAGIGEFNREFGTTGAEFSEELALCLVAMRNGIPLPSRMVPSEVQLHCYIEPHASELNFENGTCRFQKNPCEGKVTRVDQPRIVHFCGNGKLHPKYRAELDRLLGPMPDGAALAGATAPAETIGPTAPTDNVETA